MFMGKGSFWVDIAKGVLQFTKGILEIPKKVFDSDKDLGTFYKSLGRDILVGATLFYRKIKEPLPVRIPRELLEGWKIEPVDLKLDVTVDEEAEKPTIEVVPVTTSATTIPEPEVKKEEPKKEEPKVLPSLVGEPEPQPQGILYTPKVSTLNKITVNHLIYSDTAKKKKIDNTPSQKIRNRLVEVVSLLNTIQDAWGSTIYVSSGYRCDKLNKAVGGSSTSAHKSGWAADIVPSKGTPRSLYIFIAEFLIDNNIPFDQLILEYDKWVHVGLKNGSGNQRKSMFAIGCEKPKLNVEEPTKVTNKSSKVTVGGRNHQ